MPILKSYRPLGLAVLLCLCGCSTSVTSPFSAPAGPDASASLSILFVETSGSHELLFQQARHDAVSELAQTFNLRVVSDSMQIELGILEQALKGHDFDMLRSIIRPKAKQDYDIVFIAVDKRADLNLGYTGYAEGIGQALARRNSLAYGVLRSSRLQTKRIILHELGHLLGARHSFSGYMLFDSSLISLADSFGVKSFKEIQRHLISRRPFRSPAASERALK